MWEKIHILKGLIPDNLQVIGLDIGYIEDGKYLRSRFQGGLTDLSILFKEIFQNILDGYKTSILPCICVYFKSPDSELKGVVVLDVHVALQAL